ncbi:PilX N-terminal [Ectothiorhodospira mobilis]|uniref:PilX N-terminal n=1 Tax=Ectothiorhodospira mobilis TaxID=195064 RepID=A0A1I4SIB0_ECTMO|nr:pilus assembly PilX N-terminal domain-containing protein [Ectothiorhodospira mobilis]SFM64144.1 PilX N-terminal [Ectothiorhodospira mobilis]
MSIHNPERQTGAVLVVSLVILTLTTLLGVAGMNAAVIQERIAGNQKQATEAFLAAESGLAQVLAVMRHEDFDAWGDREATLQAVGAGPHAVDGDRPGQWRLESVDYHHGRATVRITGTLPGGARRSLEAELDGGPGGPVPESAYTCYGAHCETRTGSNSGSAIYFDGRNWNLPERDGCTGAGCNGTLAGEGDRAGIYLVGNADADAVGTGNQAGNNRPGQIQGDPPLRQTDAAATEGGVTATQWGAYADALAARPDTRSHTLESGERVDLSSALGSRDAPAVVEVKGEGEVRLGGNTHAAGVLILSGDIALGPANGTFTFEGLILLRDGARITSGTGTANFFGSVISLEGKPGWVDADLGGNFTLKYSTQALEQLQRHGLWGHTRPPRVVAWREILGTF